MYIEIKDKIRKKPKFDQFSDYFDYREDFRKMYSYAIPSKFAIFKIIEFSKNKTILEIGSGLGLWAFLIKKQGGNIIATDNFSWPYYNHRSKIYTQIEKLEHTHAIKKYNKCNILMLCWPPYSEPMASESLKLFSGSKLIYIGEMDGCTADEEFHQELYSNWNIDLTIHIPVWDDLYDRVYLCTKKT